MMSTLNLLLLLLQRFREERKKNEEKNELRRRSKGSFNPKSSCFKREQKTPKVLKTTYISIKKVKKNQIII